MRTLTIAAAVMFALAAPVGAQPTNAELMAPIQKFINSFNKGDTAGAASTHAAGADLTIVDEVAPFVWHGAKASTRGAPISRPMPRRTASPNRWSR